MSYAHVQSKNSGTTSASANSLAVTVSALGPGNLVTGIVTWGGVTGDLSSVTDGTNTYTIQRRVADATNGQAAASFYAKNVSGSPTTITANFGSSVPWRGLSVNEFSGGDTTAPLDGTNEQGQLQATPGTGTDGAKSGAGTKTPAADNYLVWGGAVDSGASGTGSSRFTAGTNFTENATAEHQVSGDISLSSEYWIQTTATAANASFTVAANVAHMTFMMIFKVAAAGGASVVPVLLSHRRRKL